MVKQDCKPDTPSHTPGTNKGEDWVKHGREPGREHVYATARSSTGINAKAATPIDPRMPHMPPA